MGESLPQHYLELSDKPVRFEAVNQLTNVFFDDSNKDVFAVRSGGVMGVVVKSASKDTKPLNFRMEDRGPVLSIKFSPRPQGSCCSTYEQFRRIHELRWQQHRCRVHTELQKELEYIGLRMVAFERGSIHNRPWY